MSNSPWPQGLQPIRLLYPWNSPGKNTGEAYHVLIQGIFSTQGLNPFSYFSCTGRWVHSHYRHLGSSYIYIWVKESQSVMSDHLWPYESNGIHQAVILECVAVPFSRGSSQPRDWTQVSSIAGRLFTSWTTREAHISTYRFANPQSINKCHWGFSVCQSPVHFSWTPASNFQCHQDLESKSVNGDRSPDL